VSLSVDGGVDRSIDLTQGASLLRLELVDVWRLGWKEVSARHLVVVLVKLSVPLVDGGWKAIAKVK